MLADDAWTLPRVGAQAGLADGWLRYAVPRAHGGVHDQLEVRSLCLIRETLARRSGLADFGHARPAISHGAQAAPPPVAAGNAIAALLFPGGGRAPANSRQADT